MRPLEAIGRTRHRFKLEMTRGSDLPGGSSNPMLNRLKTTQLEVLHAQFADASLRSQSVKEQVGLLLRAVEEGNHGEALRIKQQLTDTRIIYAPQRNALDAFTNMAIGCSLRTLGQHEEAKQAYQQALNLLGGNDIGIQNEINSLIRPPATQQRQALESSTDWLAATQQGFQTINITPASSSAEPDSLTATPAQSSAASRPTSSTSSVQIITRNPISSPQELAGRINEFSGALLSDLARQKPTDNLVISGPSAYTVLQMMLTGAGHDSATQREMLNALNLGGTSPDRAREIARQLLDSLSRDKSLIVANAIFYKNGLPVNSRFVEENERAFDTDVYALRLGTEGTQQINDWVYERTNGKIEKLADGAVDENDLARLLNAVYFKGAWATPFNKGDTYEASFELINGSRKQVPMMNMTEADSSLHYIRLGDLAAKATSLPFSNRFTADIVVPEEIINSTELLESSERTRRFELTEDNMRFQSGITIGLPRHKINAETQMKTSLERLGMPTAFTNGADFTEFLPSNEARISHVKQVAGIEFTEEGAEAYAATKGGMRSKGISPVITANKPFYVAIRDTQTGLNMFSAIVNNPDVISSENSRGG